MILHHMAELLDDDLQNEYMHMNFYLYHSTSLIGLHAEEYKELFAGEAKSEMAHVQQFSNVLWGLDYRPTIKCRTFPLLTDVREALQFARDMEATVVDNYATRIRQCDTLPEPNRTWLTVFLEDQLSHSRQDVDRFKRLLQAS